MIWEPAGQPDHQPETPLQKKCWSPDGCTVDLDGGETFSISALTQSPFSLFSNKNEKLKSISTTLKKMSIVHSDTEQNLSYNFKALHHARALKSPTVVIVEDPKHILILGVPPR